MRLATRRRLDRSFTWFGLFAIALLALSLAVLLCPIIARGLRAFVFQGTIDYRRMSLDLFGRGDPRSVVQQADAARAVRQPVFDAIERFERELDALPRAERAQYRKDFKEFQEVLRALLGPLPHDRPPVLDRMKYGSTRWDKAQEKLGAVLFLTRYDYSAPGQMGRKILVPRVETFRGTALEPAFAALERDAGLMLLPEWTVYWRFLTDSSRDAHFFGGIWPEVLGTLYLTFGAMLFAVPFGVVAAIYLTEYARPGRVVSGLRVAVSTLAGVPSIVFGLFGLAFFINTLGVSESKSVLAGSLTLALLVLPTIIRASEEAIRAVPRTYKEAAMSLGASRWRTVLTVIMPAALPGILTGIIISMGRAAGETAPIIFTAAVSVGATLTPLEALSRPTMALPWNIYNLATEHQAVDEIRHVQYGMVLTLAGMVLLLNLAAIVLRARISRKLRG